MTKDEIKKAFDELNAKYLHALELLQQAQVKLAESSTNNNLEEQIRHLEQALQTEKKKKEVIKEVVKQVPVEVEVAPANDIRHTAKLLVNSELNKEDLTEEELVALLQRSSEEEVKRQIGFWATTLPSSEQTQTEKRYIGKK